MVVFSCSSGGTHALSPAASAVLLALREKQGQFFSCLELLSVLGDVEAESDACVDGEAQELQALHQILDNLELFGLVQSRTT